MTFLKKLVPEFCTQIDLLRERCCFDRDSQPPKGWYIKNFADNVAVNSGRSQLFLAKRHLAFPQTPSGVTCLALLEKTAPDHGKFDRPLLTELKAMQDAHVDKQFTPDGVL
ncbi:MAG: hypothetical protein ONB48_20575 [candidate division KSB1 bacterium]|nr:hypothetical protein [candidate division KSB1 bacterium]MDZ7273381.1 hypothetical protein [candidate division KSB1 bacterium]MDZ7288043.1 hypothetical protein [candidate division KSB1 bacterium]MDZ7300105.1 hypothetical protein [candidate division KSB1 bacterium]MDZ7307229.1 hypothetical protein [candidate division KSB1 bacterium]